MRGGKKLGVPANSLRNYEKGRLIKPGRLPGGQCRYSTDELARLLSSGEMFGQEKKCHFICTCIHKESS
ncbi:MAG: MerR family transcriptional regulator [Peptococcaceae bacterium]|nr:MerR family transcriptional regulator [Peptococcaceae bacterium]